MPEVPHAGEDHRQPGFVAAILVAGTVGWGFTRLPHHLEWVELSVGVPAIFLTYFAVIGKWAFGEEDRKLFKKLPKEGSAAA